MSERAELLGECVEPGGEGCVAGFLVGDKRAQGADFPPAAEDARVFGLALAARCEAKEIDGVAIGRNAAHVGIRVAARQVQRGL